MKKLIPYFITALAPLCWAGDVVLSRGIGSYLPPFTLVYMRWALAFLILFPFALKYVKQDWAEVKAAWGSLSVFSLLGVSGFITLLYVGLQGTTSINGGLIQTTLPAILLIMMGIFYGEKASISQWLGVFLCIVGATYVITQGDWENVKNFTVARGDLLVLVATIIYGLYSALLPKSPNIHPLTFLVCIMFLGQATMLPFFVWETAVHGIPQLTWQLMSGVLFIAIFPSIIAYLCWNKGVSLIGPSRAGIMVSLIPVFTAIMAIPALKETLHGYHIVGMSTIFSGMILFNHEELFRTVIKDAISSPVEAPKVTHPNKPNSTLSKLGIK